MYLSPPSALLRYFDGNFTRPGFCVRRRFALVKSEPYGRILACCVVEAFSQPQDKVQQPRQYANAIFYEDWLDAKSCAAFIESVQKGDMQLGEVTILRATAPQWMTQTVPLANLFMSKPGIVVTCAVESRQLQFLQEPMFSISEPYFPGPEEAVRAWVGLTRYNGQSDSRNGSVIFLLPEQRAFLTRAVSNNGTLSFDIAGHDADLDGFVIKGAYWQYGEMHHFQCEVRGRQANAPVPDYPERLDYVLLDKKGELYDYQQESSGRNTGLTREVVASVDVSLTDEILQARLQGEGREIEFKPFVDPRDPLGPVENRSKLGQIVQTVVAFSNSQGGRIFIGIDDLCGLNGIEASLRAWGREGMSDALLDRYRGALTNKIAGAITGDISLSVVFAAVEDDMIAVIRVDEGRTKPVEIAGDSYYYIRAGASNRRLSPTEWARALGTIANIGDGEFHGRTGTQANSVARPNR